jgi:hypothetical protein
MKISVTGKPGNIIKKENIVMMAMQQTKIPTLPNDLPNPGDVATNYILYIAPKQWHKVDKAIKNPKDTFIVEGYPFFDKEKKVLAVFVTRATTKLLETSRRKNLAEKKDSSQSKSSGTSEP